MYAHLASNK